MWKNVVNLQIDEKKHNNNNNKRKKNYAFVIY